MPFQWAKTQTHLGNALFALGVRVDDIGLLHLAKDAYQSALDEFNGDGPNWHGEVVRKNLDAIEDALQKRKFESPAVADFN